MVFVTNTIFTRRDAILARVLQLWPGVCLSDCLPISHKSGVLSKRLNESGWFWHDSFFRLVLHCVTGNSGTSKNKGTSVWNFAPKSGLWKFRHGISVVEACCQLISRRMYALQNVINWTIIGWQYFRAPTLDRCSLSQWSSSSVCSTIPSRGSVSDSWYLYNDKDTEFCCNM